MGAICSKKVTISTKSWIYIKSSQRSSDIKIPLTIKEVDILKKTWPVFKQSWVKICSVAFERWFTLYPELRYVFRSLPTENLLFEDLFKSETLKMHVEKVRDVLEMLINKIENVEELVNTLIEFGRHHHMIGAQQKYATALAASFQYAICIIMDVDMTVENAWDSLLRFVMDLLKYGMRLQKNAQEQISAAHNNDVEIVSNTVLSSWPIEEDFMKNGIKEPINNIDNSEHILSRLSLEKDREKNEKLLLSTETIRTLHVSEVQPEG